MKLGLFLGIIQFKTRAGQCLCMSELKVSLTAWLFILDIITWRQGASILKGIHIHIHSVRTPCSEKLFYMVFVQVSNTRLPFKPLAFCRHLKMYCWFFTCLCFIREFCISGWRRQQGCSREAPSRRRACKHQRGSPEWLQTGGHLLSQGLPQDSYSGG